MKSIDITGNYDRVPLMDPEDCPIIEKEDMVPTFASNNNRSSRLSQLGNAITCRWSSSLIVATVVSLAVVIVTISSFTMHVPGGYVPLATLSQKNSIRPNFVDHDGGPIELAGSHRCGSFPSEAVEKGCVFDIMNYGFTASECYYRELAQEWRSKGPWKWYLDPNSTVEVPQDDEVLARSVEVYTELGYHIQHCKYTQRLLKMAEENDDILVPQEMAQRSHTKHCNELIEKMANSPQTTLNTWVRMIYNPCVRLSEVDAIMLADY